MFTLGISRQKIQPKWPVTLSGYYPIRLADTIHDSLWVRTHVFIEEEKEIIYVFSTFDLIAVDEKMHEAIFEQLNRKHPDFKIILNISATHTHSGPTGTLDTSKGIKQSLVEIFGEFNLDYFTYCVNQCLVSVDESLKNREEFQYKSLVDEVNTIGQDRHEPNNHGDPSLLVFEFTLNSGFKSILYLYSCHPTVLNQENTTLSADLPWGITHLLEGEVYGSVQHINGNSGNISTRFTRQSSSYEQIERYGQQLVNLILKVGDKEAQTLNTLKSSSHMIELDMKETDEMYLEVMQTKHLKEMEKLDLKYSLIRFDQFVFLTIPGEITSDLVRPLKEAHDFIFTMGYTNDYLFYFASKEMYERNEYEALSSFLKKGEIEKAITRISKQIEEIK